MWMRVAEGRVWGWVWVREERVGREVKEEEGREGGGDWRVEGKGWVGVVRVRVMMNHQQGERGTH